MKYVLIRYKELKLLVNEGCDTGPLLANLQGIEVLSKKVSDFYSNLTTATACQGAAIEKEKQILTSKIGYTIIGEPFTGQDAELYAMDKNLCYTELQLEVKRECERINIEVEKPLKTLAVRHVNNSDHKNLAQYIEYLIKKDLGI